jgi:hypothetical protein
MTITTPMITVFINLLAAVAPSIWVIAAGALGIGIGAYGRGKIDINKVVNAVRKNPTHRKPTPVKRPRK